MAGNLRPPEHFIHPGLTVTVPARVCAYLNKYAGLQEFRYKNRGVDPEVDNLLIAFLVADKAWRSSATGTAQAPKPELATDSEWLSTSQVAGRLGMTDRGVRKACTEGRLPAESVAGRWRISREALHHYLQTR